MRRIFASGFRAGFVSSFRWKLSELNCNDKGSRFSDRDYDPSKPRLHVLAQRLTRSSPTRTNDQDSSFPSMMRLGVGEGDRTHIHVPAVSIQPDDLFNCTGHAADVPSQCSSVIGRNDCIGGFAKQVSHGLVWLDRNFWTNHRCSGRQLVVVQMPVAHGVSRKSMKSVQITRLPAPPPDAKRTSRVSLCQKSVIRCPTPKVGSCLKNVTMSNSLEELARGVARVQGQPAGKEEDSEARDKNGPLLVPKSARVVSGRQHHRLRMLVDHLMCRDGRVVESLLERRAVRTLAARRSHPSVPHRSWSVLPVWKGARAPSGRTRRSPRCPGCLFEQSFCPGSSASSRFTASCCSDGSLPSFSRFGSSKLPRFHR